MNLSATNKQGKFTSNFSYKSLDSIRNKLLDLSRKNRLLNFKDIKTTTIKFVECDINMAFETLLKGQELTLNPLKQPNESELIAAGYNIDQEGNIAPKLLAEDWAKITGININYDLSNYESDTDKASKKLQVLYFADEFETYVHSLRQKAKSSIEESGVHILYIVFSFVEWYESRDSNEKADAPLLTVPVEFKVNGNSSDLIIKFKDDGASLINLTLKEKLKHDFGIELPEYKQDDVLLKAYFKELKAFFYEHNLPKWEIRESVYLTTQINFSKQVIYQDLDPSIWPLGCEIEKHPVIQKLFAKEGQSTGEVSVSVTEHNIDEIKEIDVKFPLIYDADSSQHSALIDAIEGNNLVIEGPPGTGKSQTITNLIAACINNNLKVLFVAEKMAALNVVKSRLDQAGLGKFCLELHSYKANKQAVLNDLNTALTNQPKTQKIKIINEEIKQLGIYRNQLNQYASIINSNWKNTNKTVNEILVKATKLKFLVGDRVKPFLIDNLDGELFDITMERTLRDRVKLIAEVTQKIQDQSQKSNIKEHPWYGFIRVDTDANDINNITSALKGINATVIELTEVWDNLEKDLLLNMNDSGLSYLEIIELLLTLVDFPSFDKDDDFDLIKIAIENIDETKLMASKYQLCLTNIESLQKYFKANEILNDSIIKHFKPLIQRIIDTGYPSHNSVAQIVDDCIEIKELLNIASDIRLNLFKLINVLPDNIKYLANGNLLSLKDLSIFVRLIKKLPIHLWEYRDSDFNRQIIQESIEEITPIIYSIKEKYGNLNLSFDLDNLPDNRVLKHNLDTIKLGGFFRVFSSKWRSAKKILCNFTHAKSMGSKKLIELIPKVMLYQDLLTEAEAACQKNKLLKKFYKGADTNIEDLNILSSWYQSIRTQYIDSIAQKRELTDVLHNASSDTINSIREIWEDSIESNYDDFVKSHRLLQGKFSHSEKIADSAISVGDSKTAYLTLLSGLEDAIQSFETLLLTFNIGLDVLSERFIQLEQTQRDVQALVESSEKNVVLKKLFPYSVNLLSFNSQMRDEFQRLIDIAEYFDKLPLQVTKLLLANCSYSYFSSWKYLPNTSQINLLNNEIIQKINLLESLGMIELPKWFLDNRQTYHSIFDKNDRAMSNMGARYSWQEFLQIQDSEKESSLSILLKYIVDDIVSPDQLLDVWEYAVYTQLGREIFDENPIVGKFSGFEQDSLRKRFIEADRGLLELQREEIATKASKPKPPVGTNSGVVSRFTEVSLVKHEAGKKRGHIPIRNLLSRAQETIQILKPCFMMSPMSVAQFLEPGKYKFDLVIMDEASQIKPEDAIGAIARGTSIIIVGDPKQLPPTNFFQKNYDDSDDEDEQGSIETTESILDTVTPLFHNRRLRWHYRSRHEKLRNH